MGGLATGTLNLALGLANHFNHDEHLIVTNEYDDKGFEEEYKLPKNLSIIKPQKLA